MDKVLTISPRRNHLIELLRFLSAAWVVLFHFNEPIAYIDNWYRHFCKLGYLGVPVFFLISGYCICIAQQHSKTPTEFLVRRLFRILPAYWFSLVIVCACALTIKIITGTNSTPLPKTTDGILAVIVLYTAPLSHYQTVNWVYWTLPFELFFYFVIFLSLYARARLQLLFLLVLILMSLFIPYHPGGWLFFMGELPTFILGYALYLVINSRPATWLEILLFALSAVAVYCKHPTLAYLTTVFMAAGLIVMNKWITLRDNFFSRLGNFSYSLYLIHVPVGIYLFGFLKNLQLIQKNISLNMLIDVSLLTFLIGLSAIMFKLVEQPSIKLGQKLAAKV